LDSRLLAEFRPRTLERRHHAARIDPRSVVRDRCFAGETDALLRSIRFAFELRQIAVDIGQLALDLRDAALNTAQTLLGVVGAFLLDLVLILQARQLGHALTIDRPAACLAGALDTAILGQGFHT